MREHATRSAIHDVIAPRRQWAITGHRYGGGIVFHTVLSRERIEVTDSIAMQHRHWLVVKAKCASNGHGGQPFLKTPTLRRAALKNQGLLNFR
ncbi:protein of unknown function [Burkholderia multivorans]